MMVGGVEVPMQAPAGARPVVGGAFKDWLFNLFSPIDAKTLRVGALIGAVVLANHLAKRR